MHSHRAESPLDRADARRAEPVPAGTADASTLTQLRAWLARSDLEPGARLSPERDLCGMLGVSRNELRKALAVLEREGQIWRHVGKGTFVGSRPNDELASLRALAERTGPAEVMRTRLLLEPQIAAEAALHASARDLEAMRRCVEASERAPSWRHYESWDNRLHRTIAEASRNTLVVALFDTLNAVRRAVAWQRRRQPPDRPPRDHHSFAEHRAIVAAIEARDAAAAAEAMRRHLRSVASRLLEPPA